MAKRNRNESHVVDGVEPDLKPEPTSAPEAAAKPALTSDELRAMFDAVEATRADVEAANAALEAAKDKRSEAVKAIVEAVGNKGPWTVNGVRLSVTVRGDRYNMQREGDAKLVL